MNSHNKHSHDPCVRCQIEQTKMDSMRIALAEGIRRIDELSSAGPLPVEYRAWQGRARRAMKGQTLQPFSPARKSLIAL